MRRSWPAAASPGRTTSPYLAHASAGTSVSGLVEVAGSRWAIEACFPSPKNECGLDQCEVRRYPGRHRHITLAMLGHVFLAAMAGTERGAAEPDQPSHPALWLKSEDSWHLAAPEQGAATATLIRHCDGPGGAVITWRPGICLASSSVTAPVASRGSRSRNARTVTSVFLPSLVSICAALQRLSIAAVSPSRWSGGHASPDTNLANTRTWRQQAIEDPWLVQPRARAAKATANEPCMAAGTGRSVKSYSCLKPARRPDPRRWTPQRRGSTPVEGERRAPMVESGMGTVRMPAASGLPERPVHGIGGPAVG